MLAQLASYLGNAATPAGMEAVKIASHSRQREALQPAAPPQRPEPGQARLLRGLIHIHHARRVALEHRIARNETPRRQLDHRPSR